MSDVKKIIVFVADDEEAYLGGFEKEYGESIPVYVYNVDEAWRFDGETGAPLNREDLRDLEGCLRYLNDLLDHSELPGVKEIISREIS